MAGVARTPITPVRVPLDLKEAAVTRAQEDGLALSAVVIAALRDYVSGTWAPRSDNAHPDA